MVTLNTILLSGILMAFIFPAMAFVSLTLPAPTTPSNSSVNITQLFNTTGIYVQNQFNGTFQSLNSTLLGKNGSFSTNPTIFSAFAFIINGLGTIMTTIIQIPYLDYISMQVLLTGLSTVIQGISFGIISTGLWLLYTYMLICIMLLGISIIQKYNLKEG